MKQTFINLLTYLKKPILEKDSNTNLKYRFKIFSQILIICILTGVILSPMFALIEEMNWVNMENHKVEEMFKGMNKLYILLLAAIVVPVIEEVIFRGPLTAFKKPQTFRIVFYFFALLFGFVHITNFEITTNVLLLSPLLVLPQILVGSYFGYLRVRFGLQWSMLLHGSYNCFFLLLSFIPE